MKISIIGQSPSYAIKKDSRSNIITPYIDKRKDKLTIAFKCDSLALKERTNEKIFQASIPGYNQEKEEFYECYLKPLWETNYKTGISPSILISSPDKYVADNFKKSAYDAANDMGLNCTIFSCKDSSLFFSRLSEQLENNKKYYIQHGKRSIIFIDEPEKFLGINAADLSSRINLILDEQDRKIINRNKNADTIAKFKTLLDYCHELPDGNKKGFATTFIFSTKYPHLIHPDFRDGKMSKLYFDFPKNENLIEILRKQSNNIKDFDISNNKIKNIEIPQDTLGAHFLKVFVNPNQYVGAYSSETLGKAAQKACIKMMEDSIPFPFTIVFADIISKTPRDISGEQIVKYNKIKNSFIKKSDKYEELIDLKNDGMLDDKELKALEQIMTYEKKMGQHFLSKKNRGLLTPDEDEIFLKLQKRYDNNFTNFDKETSEFCPSIKSVAYDGIQLDYAPFGNVILYNGQFGRNKSILWAESSSEDALRAVLDNLGLIKKQKQFEHVKFLQMSKFDGIEKIPQMEPIFVCDAERNMIYQMKL